MITTTSQSDAIEVAARRIEIRGAGPSVAAVAGILVAVALWHAVIGTALGALP